MPIRVRTTSGLTGADAPYVLFVGGPAVAMSELAGNDAGWYEAADAAIASAGVGAGVHDAVVLQGDSANPDATDPELAQVQGFRFDGATELLAALPGAAMDLVDAPNATAVTALQNGLALATKLQRYVSLLARDDAEAEADLAAELAEINADYGTGVGDYSSSVDALELKSTQLVTLNNEIQSVGNVATSIDLNVDDLHDAQVLLVTTVASVTSPTELVLTTGLDDDDLPNDMTVVLIDADSASRKSVLAVADYESAGPTLHLASVPGFTVAATDVVLIRATNPRLNANFGQLVSDNTGNHTIESLSAAAEGDRDDRDHEPVQHTWRLARQPDGSLTSVNTLYIPPGDTKRAEFDCDSRAILPTGAVVSTMTAPSSTHNDITTAKLGTAPLSAKVSVTADAGAAEGTEAVIETKVTNNIGGGPTTLRGKVIVKTP